MVFSINEVKWLKSINFDLVKVKKIDPSQNAYLQWR